MVNNLFENYTQDQITKLHKFLIKLDIPVNNINLYLEAFTHGSYTNTKNNIANYQRLEFLGDAIVDCEASLYIFDNFPEYREGEMTKFRAKMIQEQTLAYFADKLNLSSYIITGKNMDESKINKKIKSDLFESLIGAIYIDLGHEQAKSFLLKHFFTMINDAIESLDIHDYKTKLQEDLQAKSNKSLKYKIISNKLNKINNSSIFHVGVYIEDLLLAEGKGLTRKKAEQEAAKNALNIKARDTLYK